MISRKLHFEISFPGVPVPVKDLWLALMGYLEVWQSLPEKFQISQITGHDESIKSEQALFLKPSEVSEVISSRRLDGFRIHTGYSEDSVAYSLSHAKELGRQSVLLCRLEANAAAPSDWTGLIEGISVLWPTIGAWQFNKYYRSWQSSSSIAGYERRYGEMPPLVKTYTVKSVDGIGPDREFIEFSTNPGRSKEILPTIRFSPSGEMWLGPHFWQYAACTKEEILGADFFLEKRETPHFLYLKSWPEPFTRPDGEQGRVQQKLWSVVIPRGLRMATWIRWHLRRAHVWSAGAEAKAAIGILGCLNTTLTEAAE